MVVWPNSELVENAPMAHMRHAWIDPGEEKSDNMGRSWEDNEDAHEDVVEVNAMKKRRAFIIAQLHNVGHSIRAIEKKIFLGKNVLEIPRRNLTTKDIVDESKPESFLGAVDWNTGMLDEPGPTPLTDRAMERAGALLRYFDADADGLLSFEEFRAYLIALHRNQGFVGKRLTTSREFWFNYVTDQAAPALGKDCGVLSTGDKLTEAGFVGHRRQIEHQHPLEQDLLSLGIDILPRYLSRWQVAKDVFDRIDLEWAIMRASETGRADVDPPADLEGRVEKGEVQLLLADAGEIMTKARLEQELSFAFRRTKVLYQLLEERRKRNRLGACQTISQEVAYDKGRVHRNSWLSWFMSGRTRETGISWLESALIRAKTGVTRTLRNFGPSVGAARRCLESLGQRGLISSALLMPLKESHARAMGRIFVGNPADDGSGFSLSLSFMHKANASTSFSVESLPPGIGLSITLDLESKNEASEQDLESAADIVAKVMRAHVLPELKRSSMFHSMRVTRATTLQGKSRVVRVILFWRSQANIDFVCRQLKLGLRLTDIVREFTASFFCPLSLLELLESETRVLNRCLEASLTAEMSFCGPLIAKIMEECLAVMEENLHLSTVDSVEHDLERAEREARTRDAAPSMGHPLVAPKRQVSSIASKGRERDGSGRSGAVSQPCGRRQTERERRRMIKRIKLWVDRTWSAAAKLRGAKTFALDLEAATPLEFLESRWLEAHLPTSWRLGVREVFSAPGYLARWFGRWKNSLLHLVNQLDAKARTHLERARSRQQTAEKKAAVAAKSIEQHHLGELEAELARLGVSPSLFAETLKEKEEETDRILREAADKQMEEYADLAEVFRTCTSSLLGPMELRVQSGLNLLVLEMQGLDIFDILSTQDIAEDGQYFAKEGNETNIDNEDKKSRPS